MSASILVPFSIDPDALQERAGEARWVSHHRRALEMWRDNGVLLIPESDLHGSALVEAVRQLSGDAKKLWEVALTKGRLRVFVNQNGDVLPAVMPKGVSAAATVVAVSDAAATELRATIPSGVEIATLDVVDQCDAFVEARRLARDAVATNDEVAKVWLERVVPLIKYATRRITLVDRYAVSSAWESRRRNSYGGTGLARFLKEASASSGEAAIEVFAADGELRPGTMLSDLRLCADEVLGRKRRRIHAFCVPARSWKKEVHYRCILVDSSSCLVLDYGVQAFNGSRVGKKCTLRLTHPESVVGGDLEVLRRDAEQELI